MGCQPEHNIEVVYSKYGSKDKDLIWAKVILDMVEVDLFSDLVGALEITKRRRKKMILYI